MGEHELASEQAEAAWHQLPATSGMHTASWPLHRGKDASSQELPRTVSADPAVKGASALGEVCDTQRPVYSDRKTYQSRLYATILLNFRYHFEFIK